MSNAVPEGWAAHELGALAQKIEGGGTPTRAEPKYWNGNIPWATVKDLRGVSLGSTEDFITNQGLENSASKLIPANTIIIASRMAVGKAVYFNRSVAINQDLKALYPKSCVNWRFLLQWYLSKSEQIESLATGSTVKGIRLDDLKLLPIDLPPLLEQQKIATILSSVDNVIETTRAQIDKLKDLKIGMMQELLTKGIGVDGVPHTKFKDSPVGWIPASWDVARLDELANVGSSKRIRESEYVPEGVPFFRSKEVIRRSKGLEIDKTLYISRKRFIEISGKFGAPKQDDILITAVGTIGTVYLVEDREFYFKDGNLLWLRNIRSTVSAQYLAKIMGSEGFQAEIDRVTGGSSQAALTIEKLQELTVVVPPLNEQEDIVRILVSLDEKYRAMYRKLLALQQLKNALMQDLLTGKVRVNVEEKEKESVVA